MNHEHVEYILFTALKISNLQGKLFGHICQTQEAFESEPAQDVSRRLAGLAQLCFHSRPEPLGTPGNG